MNIEKKQEKIDQISNEIIKVIDESGFLDKFILEVSKRYEIFDHYNANSFLKNFDSLSLKKEKDPKQKLHDEEFKAFENLENNHEKIKKGKIERKSKNVDQIILMEKALFLYRKNSTFNKKIKSNSDRSSPMDRELARLIINQAYERAVENPGSSSLSAWVNQLNERARAALIGNSRDFGLFAKRQLLIRQLNIEHIRLNKENLSKNKNLNANDYDRGYR